MDYTDFALSRADLDRAQSDLLFAACGLRMEEQISLDTINVLYLGIDRAFNRE